MLLVLLAPVSAVSAETPQLSGRDNPVYLPVAQTTDHDFLNCRLGVGAVINPVTTYNLAPFRFGWYVDWAAATRAVSPLEHYHTIRVQQDRAAGRVYLSSYSVRPPLNSNPSGLGGLVRANPGHVWLVGNEPDRVLSQDDVLPEMYAEIYHDVYHFIKAIDPTARVAIGAVVQPTPLRLEYLDRILAAYRAKYDTRLPVDVWNTHIYIIREVKGDWGGDIPPGIDAETGRLYSLLDHLDINIFKSLVVELRTWMKARGYQDVPLIVTEYGALMPLWFLSNVGYTQDDVNRFIKDAAYYMASATDPSLGYGADGHRLVQQAALYSLDDDSTISDGFLRWGSFLMHSTPPYKVTETGSYFRDIIAAQTRATVDLLPYRASVTPRFTGGQAAVSPTVRVSIANAGNAAPAKPVKVRFFDLTGGQRVQIGADIDLPAFTGCGALREVTVSWPDLAPGIHNISIEVDPDKQINEVSEANNTMHINVRITERGLFLPLIHMRR